VRALFDEAQRAFGGIDVLVNNAGIMKLAPVAYPHRPRERRRDCEFRCG